MNVRPTKLSFGCFGEGAWWCHGRGFGWNSGFTLVELMIVLIVIGVMSLTVSSFGDLIKRYRITTETNTFRAMLSYARQGAIQLNTDMILDPGSWSGDMGIRTVSADVSDPPLREWAANFQNLTVEANSAASDGISFDSRGRLDEAAVGLIAICDYRGKAAGQVITIELVGRISVSDASNFAALNGACQW